MTVNSVPVGSHNFTGLPDNTTINITIAGHNMMSNSISFNFTSARTTAVDSKFTYCSLIFISFEAINYGSMYVCYKGYKCVRMDGHTYVCMHVRCDIRTYVGYTSK